MELLSALLMLAFASTACALPVDGGSLSVLNGISRLGHALYKYNVQYSEELRETALKPNLGYLVSALENNLYWSPGNISYSTEDNIISPTCKTIVEYEGMEMSDFKLYTVKYDDCDQPWRICRHKDSEATILDLAETLGKLPIGMRSWVREVINIPETIAGVKIQGAYSTLGAVVPRGLVGVWAFAHEATHCFDCGGGLTGWRPEQAEFDQTDPARCYNTGPEWKNAVRADSVVPDEYSRVSYAEDLAQMSTIGLYDTVVPGGFKGLDWMSAILLGNQLDTIKKRAGHLFQPGGRCDSSIPVDPLLRWHMVADGLTWETFDGTTWKPIVWSNTTSGTRRAEEVGSNPTLP